MSAIQPTELQIPMPWGYIAGCWYGDQHKRPLLALHGWQDNAGSFARLAPLIAPQRPILAIDLPGHGRSSHFPAGLYYHFSDFIRVVQRIARYYKWHTISFIGHSMGAAISFYYAALFPSRADMIIAIDALTSPYFPLNLQIDLAALMTEKALNEEDRLEEPPPLYTYESLRDLLYRGSEQSVELEYCEYLLERSVRRVENNLDMFYFVRDSRVKLVEMTFPQPELVLALATRLRNIHYLVLKAEYSEHLNVDNLKEAFNVLHTNNLSFEFHVLKGEKHHMHLNSPHRVADKVKRFLCLHGGGKTEARAKL